MAATRTGDGTAAVAGGGPPPGPARARAATPLLVDGRVAPLAGEAVDLEARILDAALACISRWGVAKTTLDDVAREAGCSRATVYRVVPGGKDGLVTAACERELRRFFGHLGSRIDAEPTVGGRLALAIAESTRVLAGHAALGYLIEHEPEVVLPFISFDALDPLLGAAAEFGEVVLGSFLAADDAREAGEWAARVALSYGFEPDDRLDLTDLEVARRFVRTYVPHIDPARPPARSDDVPLEKELLHVDH